MLGLDVAVCLSQKDKRIIEIVKIPSVIHPVLYKPGFVGGKSPKRVSPPEKAQVLVEEFLKLPEAVQKAYSYYLKFFQEIIEKGWWWHVC